MINWTNGKCGRFRDQSHLGIVHILDFLSRTASLVSFPPTGLYLDFLPSWICWNLWTARNHRLFSDSVFSEQEVMLKSLVDARIWQEAQKQKGTTPQSSPASIPVIAPARVSCNIDAAWQAESQSCGMGMIFHFQEEGRTISFSSSRRDVASPLAAEAWTT
ncbi:uncharacterized protein LOC18025408 [Eutrema salsugineum]|uniref:uncharacterized protein LOC18025408 n=1 Tax=Eutrema salsugineum TaxID=72664 RepID=UPI000CED5358|nr:uncharacterized protein LOC18025408 [Eutrema salsugineum]